MKKIACWMHLTVLLLFSILQAQNDGLRFKQLTRCLRRLLTGWSMPGEIWRKDQVADDDVTLMVIKAR